MKYEGSCTVHYSAEDKCFIAESLEYSSIKTHGNTIVDAVNELETVLNDIRDWDLESEKKKFTVVIDNNTMLVKLPEDHSLIKPVMLSLNKLQEMIANG